MIKIDLLPVPLSGTGMAVTCTYIWCHSECSQIRFTAETEQTIERVIYMTQSNVYTYASFCPLNLAPGVASKRNP